MAIKVKLSDIMPFAVIDKQEKTEKSDDQSTDIVFTRAEKESAFQNCRNSIRTMLNENKRIVLMKRI